MRLRFVCTVIRRASQHLSWYGLTKQIRRATASIGANIAEGTGRNSGPDFGRFLQMALGSASELEYHMILASDLEYLNPAIAEEIIEKAQEVKRMLTSLIQKVRAPKSRTKLSTDN